MVTRKVISKQLQQAPWLLAGTIVERFLKCQRKDCAICRKQGGHGPAYYLSIRESGRTRMIYIPKAHLAQVRRAIKDYHSVRDGLVELTKSELVKWRNERKHRA